MAEEKLISAVRFRTFIYNKSDKRHADRDFVAAAWENTANDIGENGKLLFIFKFTSLPLSLSLTHTYTYIHARITHTHTHTARRR